MKHVSVYDNLTYSFINNCSLIIVIFSLSHWKQMYFCIVLIVKQFNGVGIIFGITFPAPENN